MFMGVRNDDGISVSDYASALRRFEQASRTPTGRDRCEGSWGFPLGGKSGVTHIRKDSNDAVIFRLYGTDCVIWYPDNSFATEAYGTVTTGAFINRYMPGGIWANGISSTMSYRGRDGDDSWGGRMICHGDAHFRPVDGTWEPDIDGLRSFRAVTMDTKLTRQIAKDHHLAAFKLWLEMAPQLLDLVHVEDDEEAVRDALLERDFRTAAVHLSLAEDKQSYGRYPTALKIATGSSRLVTMGALARFRLWLYEDEGAVVVHELKTQTCAAYRTQLNKIRALRNAGTGSWHLEYGR